MTSTTNTECANSGAIPAKLRHIAHEIRRKSTALSDFIPLIQQAADTIDALRASTAQAMADEYMALMAHMDAGGDYFEFMAKQQHGNPDAVAAAFLALPEAQAPSPSSAEAVQPGDTRMLLQNAYDCIEQLRDSHWAHWLAHDVDLAEATLRDLRQALAADRSHLSGQPAAESKPQDTESLDEDARDALLALAVEVGARYDGFGDWTFPPMDSNEVVALMTGIPLPARYGEEWCARFSRSATPPASPTPSVRLRFTEEEVRDLTAMIWGAPCGPRDLMVARAVVYAFESLNDGERPRDPAKGGRLIDMPEALLAQSASPTPSALTAAPTESADNLMAMIDAYGKACARGTNSPEKFNAIEDALARLIWDIGMLFAPVAAPTFAPTDEREAFEAWASAHYNIKLTRAGDGYMGNVNDDWSAWQARAILASGAATSAAPTDDNKQGEKA